MKRMTMLAVTMMGTLHSKMGFGSGVPVEMGSLWWFIYGGISVFLVCFAGIMSGLTLGLMSLGLMDLEVLQRSGTPVERKQAGGSLFLVLNSTQIRPVMNS